MQDELRYFLPYQRRWILDPATLKIMEKSRQIGISYADAYRSVRMVSRKTIVLVLAIFPFLCRRISSESASK